jgi:hypothetical protein
MDMSQSQRAELSDLTRQMARTGDIAARMALFGQFRNRVVSHLDAVRSHGEALAIQVYIDRLERLSPEGESWQAIFQALQSTLSDTASGAPSDDTTCELI